jgi:transcription elongation factor SPT6
MVNFIQQDGQLTKFEILKQKVKGRYEELKKYLSENNPENVRVLTDVEFESVLSIEELGDVYNHMILHYEKVLPAIMSTEDEDLKNLRDLGNVDLDLYFDIAVTGLGRFVNEYYGLNPMQFGENMREELQLNGVRQIEKLPRTAAKDYVSTDEIETKFSDYKDVLDVASYMLAAQIAGEPLVRRCARKSFVKYAYIHVLLTEQGLKEIDGNHPSCKFLKEQPVRDLEDDQFLRLVVAEQAGVLTIVIQMNIEGATNDSYVKKMKSLFTHDLFNKDDELVKNWDAKRTKVIDQAFHEFLLPQLEKKLRVKLLNEAKEFVVRDVLYGKGERRQSKAEEDSEQPEHSSTVTTPSSAHRKRKTLN